MAEQRKADSGSGQRTLRILAADDSAVMRRILRTVFELHAADRASVLPRMELCGVVSDGLEALAAVERLSPDLLLLDLEMPHLGGLKVLDQLRSTAPALPVIMCSAHTKLGAQTTLDALRRGANDYVMKPGQQTDLAAALGQLTEQLLPKIAALTTSSFTHAGAQTVPRPVVSAASPAARGEGLMRSESMPAWSVPASMRALRTPMQTPPSLRGDGAAPVGLVVIAVSTGGPLALETLLPLLPANFPVPVMIVQHMPKVFTGVLAERLDTLCRLRVAEAREGERIAAGSILLAPGDAHMEAAAMPYAAAGATHVRLHQGPALNSCKPSADYLFTSAARLYGAGTLALVLTGMGSDGLEGARAVQRAGGMVLAQDEASSAVWGMPGRVSREGIAAATLPLRALAGVVTQRVFESRTQAPVAAANEFTVRREASYGLF